MPIYENFVYDFPRRCAAILKRQNLHSQAKDYEVTLMLSIASTGFTVPFERLKDPQGRLPHPSEDRDKKQFKKVKKAYNKLCQKNFIDSSLGKATEGVSWFFGEVIDVTLEPEYWPELKANRLLPLKPTVKVPTVLNHVRNALAHGNIFVKPAMNGEIGQIILIKEVLRRDPEDKLLKDAKGNYVRDRFEFLLCSPSTFLAFLLAWFAFLEKLGMPRDVIPGSIAYEVEQAQPSLA